MRRTFITTLSKRITIPRLYPTHTTSRIVQILVPPNNNTTTAASGITDTTANDNDTVVAAYDPVMILECSPDLIADPADRISPNHKPLMLIETCDEGHVVWDRERLRLLSEENGNGSRDDDNGGDGEWLNVGTVVGVVDDGDDVDGDWLWEAYLHNDSEE